MVVSRTGMAFYRDRDEALARAVGARIAALALPCCDAYRRHLLDADHAAEWDTLVDQITIGETYFFRYPVQFDALREVVFPDLVERRRGQRRLRSEEHTSELQSLMRISYAVFCLKKKNK